MKLPTNLTRWLRRISPTVFYTGPTVRIYMNRNITMSNGKFAAQAVHAALDAFGVNHGRVIVLMGSPTKIRTMPHQIHDAGHTELEPGTLTAGAQLEAP